MFATPSSASAPSSSGPRSLFQVVDVADVSSAPSKVQDETEAAEKAAKHRIAKKDRANHAAVHGSGQGAEDLYDEKDQEDFDEDVDNILDVTAMGEDSKQTGSGKSNTAAKENARGSYNDILEDEHIEPLNMKDELRKGEVGLYGEMRKKRRRGEEDEDDPTELAGTDGNFKNKDKKKSKTKRRRRLATGESESESESDDDGLINDTEENEELNAEDAWLATVTKDEDGIYHGRKSESKKPEAERPPYLKDQHLALKELQAMLKEGPAGENVLRLIKRLSPSNGSNHPNKRSKSSENDVPSTNASDNTSIEEVTAKKETFEKCVAIADFLMDSGFTTVYQASYEDVTNRLDPKKAKASKKEEEEGQTTESIEQGQEGAFWQYKWSLDAEEKFGPFDTESIKGWAASFAQYPTMVVRGGASPAAVSKLGNADGWVTFEPFLWS